MTKMYLTIIVHRPQYIKIICCGAENEFHSLSDPLFRRETLFIILHNISQYCGNLSVFTNILGPIDV